MNIIYLLSSVLFVILFTFLKKTDNKQNLLADFFLSIVFFFCYTSIIVFILSLFDITASILIRSIINFVISIVFGYLIIFKKHRQSMTIKWFDIIAIAVFIIAGLYIYSIRFKSNGIYFETTDPAVHYALGDRFSNTSRLTMDTQKETFYGSDSFDLFTSYVSIGTVFQFFGDVGIISKLDIFIGFEVAILIFSAIAMYFMITYKVDSVKKRIIVVLMCGAYLFGYPFSNLLFGFHYLGMGVMLASVIFCIYNRYRGIKKKTIISYIELSILNFCLFSLYYLFVPIIYGAEGFIFLYDWFLNRKKKGLLKKTIIDITITLVIPFSIGMFIYFVYPRLLYGVSDGFGTFMLEGYVYRNLFGNVLLFIPIIIYSIAKSIKEKRVDVLHIAFILIFMFMMFVFYRVYNGKAQTYYYFKLYYMLAMIIYGMVCYELVNNKDFMVSINAVYISVLVILQLICLEGTISDQVFLLNPVHSISSVNAALEYNQEVMAIREPIYTREELESMDKLIMNNKDKLSTGNVVSNLDLLQRLWIYSLYDVSTSEDPYYLGSYYEVVNFEEVLKNEKMKYIITSPELIEEMDNKIINKCSYIYSDDNYVLLSINR